MSWELGDDKSGVSAPRARSITDCVATEIRNAPPGTAPGGLTRWAHAQKGDIPWERALRDALRRAVAHGSGQTDYSWTLPSRRHRGPAILPRLRGKETNVLCVIDTSGSMTQDDIDRALGEVASVARAMCVAHTWLVSCDTEVTFHGRVRKIEDLELVGGGGTSLEKALDVIDTHRIDPDVVVFLTDGFAPWSASPPPELARRSIIVVTPAGNPTGPDWAESIVVGPDSAGFVSFV
jgi:predicted metal-dependent peptidase